MAFGSLKTLLTNQTCRKKKTVGATAQRRTRTEGVVSNKSSMSDVNECSYRSLGCDHDSVPENNIIRIEC